MNNFETQIHSTDLPELEGKETKIKHHRTRFIIYLVLSIFSWLIISFSTLLGGLIGSIFGLGGAVWGVIIFFWGSVIAAVAFVILAVYNLVKWLNA